MRLLTDFCILLTDLLILTVHSWGFLQPSATAYSNLKGRNTLNITAMSLSIYDTVMSALSANDREVLGRLFADLETDIKFWRTNAIFSVAALTFYSFGGASGV